MARLFPFIATLGLIFSILAATPSAASTSRATKAVARVRFIYRGLEVQVPAQPLHRASVNQALYSQTLLRTSVNEKASLRFDDGTTLQINESTDAVLTSPTLTQVKHGEVAQYLAPGSTHRVEAGGAIAAAIGTTYDARF